MMSKDDPDIIEMKNEWEFITTYLYDTLEVGELSSEYHYEIK